MGMPSSRCRSTHLTHPTYLTHLTHQTHLTHPTCSAAVEVSSRMPRRLFLLLYAASGAAALLYEIAWTRLLTLLMGQTVAAASTALAAIMGGLALGSWIGGRAQARWTGADKHVRALLAYAALEVFVALAAFALPLLLSAGAP